MTKCEICGKEFNWIHSCKEPKPPARESVGLSELLACPFCGSEATIKKYIAGLGSTNCGQVDFEAVSCSNKNCELASYGISEKTWNTRAS